MLYPITLNDEPILPGTSAECFARHFSDKIKINVALSKLDPKAYNGKCKLIVDDCNFIHRFGGY